MPSEQQSVFQLKRIIKEVRAYPAGEWRKVEVFEKWVGEMNLAIRTLQSKQGSRFSGITQFRFDSLHYSGSRKTINDRGYQAILIHLELIESVMDQPDKRSGDRSVSGASPSGKPKIFLVHGRDETAKAQTEAMIFRLGMEPVVLHRQANIGQTIVEKFEKHSNVDFAVVLLTPDDVGALYDKQNLDLKPRARQNVIFELGFFYGKLGRERVCCIMKSGLEKPSDIDGIVYLVYSGNVDSVELELQRELRQLGLI